MASSMLRSRDISARGIQNVEREGAFGGKSRFRSRVLRAAWNAVVSSFWISSSSFIKLIRLSLFKR